MKSFVITAVRLLFTIDKPIVVLEVAGNPDIVRNPKQAFVDLQNSGRCLKLHAKALDRGIENLSATDREIFMDALYELQGATVTGNIINRKAGDKYIVTGNHPALTDPNHPQYGKVKDGGELIAEKDGVYVEGFLNIPLTQGERMNKSVAKELAGMFANLYGFTSAAPAPVATPSNAFGDDAGEPDDAANASKEAVGAAKGGK